HPPLFLNRRAASGRSRSAPDRKRPYLAGRPPTLGTARRRRRSGRGQGSGPGRSARIPRACRSTTGGEVQESVGHETVEQKQRNRSDSPEAYGWRLEDRYASGRAWEEECGRREAMSPRLGEFRGTLGQSPARLADCFRLRDQLSQRRERLMVYAITRRDED